MEGINATGAKSSERELNEILIDSENKIISAPCYMMDATILEIRQNIKQAIDALNQL
jgi:enhancing lycopene biosynthesis protein 2